MDAFSTRRLVSDRPKPRRAFLRSVRSPTLRRVRGTIATEPRVGSPVAILVPGRGVVVTSPIVRLLGLVGSTERLFETRRGNTYALWVEDEAEVKTPTRERDSEPAATPKEHHEGS